MENDLSFMTPDVVEQLIGTGYLSPDLGQKLNEFNTLETPAVGPSPTALPSPTPAPADPLTDAIQMEENVNTLQSSGHITPEQAQKIKQRINPAYLQAVKEIENDKGDPNAVSPKGAIGIMQVMPRTGKEVANQLGIENPDLRDPATNEAIGTEYLRQMQEKYGPILGAAAYNAGPGRLDEAIKAAGSTDPMKVFPFLPPETQNYVKQFSAKIATSPTAAEDPFQLQQQATIEGAAAGAKAAAEEAAYHEQQTALLKKQEAEVVAEEQRREKAMAEQQAKVDQALSDYGSMKIDPDRYWHNKSTGEKVLAGIAIALSSIGQGLQAVGGVAAPNQAMKVISDSIERDIEAQKMDIQLKRDQVQGQQNILNDMRARFGDERQAETAARMIGLEVAKSQLAQFGLNHQSEVVQANAKLLYGQIAEKQQQYALDLQKQALDAQKTMMANPAMKEALAQKIAEKVLNNQIDPSQLSDEQKKLLVPVVVKGPDGKAVIVATGGMVGDTTDAKELRDQTAGYVTLKNVLSEIRDLRSSEGGSFENDLTGHGASVKSRYQALRGKAVEAMKKFGKLGTLDSGVERLADMGVPTIDELMSHSFNPISEAPAISKLNQSLKTLDDQYNNEVASKVIQPSARAKGLTTDFLKGGKPGF